MTQISFSQQQIERFLFDEVELLDTWELTRWFELFEEGGTYHVPPAGAGDNADPTTSLFYISDDYQRLRERVIRLLKRTAHVEFPHSTCRHLVTNVRVMGGDDSEFTVRANFHTFRTKRGVTENYFGHHIYQLTTVDGSLRIRKKASFLDADDLNDQGKVSIII